MKALFYKLFPNTNNISRILEYCCTRYTTWDLKLKSLILFYPVQYIYIFSGPNNNSVIGQEISVTEHISLDQVLQINNQTKSFQCSEEMLSILSQIPEISVALQTQRSVSVSTDQNIRDHLWTLLFSSFLFFYQNSVNKGWGGPLISVGIFRPKFAVPSLKTGSLP